MTNPTGKPTAHSSAAAAKTTNGLSPLQWGDKCFLCGRTIGESDPIGFYQGKNAMMRSHRGCLNQMEMVGGTPKDFHEYHAKKQARTEPVHQDVVNHRAEVSVSESETPVSSIQARNIQFDDLQQLMDFVEKRGRIPKNVRVNIGAWVIQRGG